MLKNKVRVQDENNKKEAIEFVKNKNNGFRQSAKTYIVPKDS